MSRMGERGAALMAVLLFMILIVLVTAGVMNILRADLTAGVRQQQSVQVFNVAESGVHYAIARLQTSGAATYGGESLSIADGSVAIGSTVVTVRCLDGTLPSPPTPCAGPNAAYRRIVSTASLVVPGPVRVMTAIVEGTTSSTSNYAICAYNGISFDQQVQVYGSVGSGTTISLAGPMPNRAVICDSTSGGLGGACGTPNPSPITPFTAGAYAVGTITCSQGCANQVEGTVAPNQPAGSVCPSVTLTPPSPPGTTNLTVPLGSTIIVNPATNYGAVTLADTPGNPSPCPPNPLQRSTLAIDSGIDPNATVTVRMRTLLIGHCARVAVTGVGKVVLWLLEPTGQALTTAERAVLGTTSLLPALAENLEPPIEGGRFTINVVSTNSTAVRFNQGGLIAATFIIPNGGYSMDQAQLTNGAILANTVHLDQGTTFTWDPRARIGDNSYSSFNQLRYWKDQ